MTASEKEFGSGIVSIPVDQITNLDDICRENLHIRKMSEMLSESYDKTRAKVLEVATCEGMYEAFAIGGIDESSVTLGQGTRLACPIFASALKDAEFAVVFAVVAKGFEDIVDDSGDSMLDSMMYGGWGVGCSTGAQQWFESHIRDRAHELGLYTGKSWSPGLENVEMELQRPLFELIDASKIGLELRNTGAVRPSLSVTGIIAVGTDPDLEQQETAWMI